MSKQQGVRLTPRDASGRPIRNACTDSAGSGSVLQFGAAGSSIEPCPTQSDESLQSARGTSDTDASGLCSRPLSATRHTTPIPDTLIARHQLLVLQLPSAATAGGTPASPSRNNLSPVSHAMQAHSNHVLGEHQPIPGAGGAEARASAVGTINHNHVHMCYSTSKPSCWPSLTCARCACLKVPCAGGILSSVPRSSSPIVRTWIFGKSLPQPVER